MRSFGRIVAVLLATVGTAALAAVPASAAQGDLTGGRLSTCFWHYGAVGVNDYNIAYPDAGATYWVAFVRRPAGSTLKIHGTYPHARYTSLISYDSAGQIVDGTADYQWDPDAGSANPFRPGADRTTPDEARKYTVNVLNARATTDGSATGPNLFPVSPGSNEPARNDLYARPRTPLAETLPAPTVQLELIILRVYVPDNGADLNGNVPMPTPELTLADGTNLTGQAACDAMDSESTQYAATHAGATRLPDPTSLLINQQAYDALRYPDQLPAACDVFAQVGCPPVSAPYPGILPQQNNTQPGATPLVALPRTPGSLPATFPATATPTWRAQYSRRYLLQTWTGDDAPGAETNPLRIGGGGFFPNIHNNYIRAALNRKFGKVAVIKGKLPTSPTTFNGDATMGGGFQDRYTSLCMNESVRTTRVMDCRYDESIPVDAGHYYTAVTSRTEDRPANATAFCGVAWIQWGPHGDGASYAGDTLTDDDFGWLQIRNMLPDPSFAQAIQNTHTPGDEKAVMGDYLPDVTYAADAAAFESQQGCAWANPGVPQLAAGSSTPNNGSFTLQWDATRNANKFPNMRYTLQHRNATGDWADVATDLATPSYTFTAGSPESEGTWTYRVTALDGTAKSGSAGASSAVKVDTSAPAAPTATATRAPDYAGGGGWYRDAVTVGFTDNGDPTLADGSAGSGVDPASVPAPQTVTANGASTVTGKVKDLAGNESPVAARGVQVDAADPSLSVTCPATVLLNGTASATTSATDDGSGLAANPSGTTPVSTGTPGPKTTTRTATDNVGHTVTKSCTTRVQYALSNLYPNANGSGVFKKGLPIPVAFRLTDALGHSVSGTVAILDVAKVTGGVEGTYQPAVSFTGLAHANQFLATPILGAYAFDLKTASLTVGTWSLRISLADGTQHTLRVTLN